MEMKTPLYDEHIAEGGKIVPFAGYLLPIQYSAGVVKEHMAVRNAAGLFDVSHMGEITVAGPGALATLNHLMTNDFTNMSEGRVRYSVMCREDGGCIDDLVVYKFGDESYYVVVNAANRHKDFKHMKDNALPHTEVIDISDSVAQLAVQGPRSYDIISKLLSADDIPEKYYTSVREVFIKGIRCMISRTGYTGELGYELYTSAKNAGLLWKILRKAGEEFGMIPCGLGARDTLRLEAAMPLYGHEMNENITPLEAGLSFAVKLGKDEFIGREALVSGNPPKKLRIGLEVTGRGIIRENQDIYSEGRKIGVSTSGTYCPKLKKALAMALVDATCCAADTFVEADVRGHMIPAKIVSLPFYKR